MSGRDNYVNLRNSNAFIIYKRLNNVLLLMFTKDMRIDMYIFEYIYAVKCTNLDALCSPALRMSAQTMLLKAFWCFAVAAFAVSAQETEGS